MERHATPSTKAERLRLHALASRFDVRREEAARGHRLGDVLAIRKPARPDGNPVVATAIRIGTTILQARGFLVGLAGDLYALDPVALRDGHDLTADLAGNEGWWTLHPDPRAELEWSDDTDPAELAFN